MIPAGLRKRSLGPAEELGVAEAGDKPGRLVISWQVAHGNGSPVGRVGLSREGALVAWASGAASGRLKGKNPPSRSTVYPRPGVGIV